ncbi:hypothetical protein [Nocardia sp. 852002-20019_SCH5090214]|nr:hypothetical protein [Nocardia sp. 852002-20019_SCH5090214]
MVDKPERISAQRQIDRLLDSEEDTELLLHQIGGLPVPFHVTGFPH